MQRDPRLEAVDPVREWEPEAAGFCPAAGESDPEWDRADRRGQLAEARVSRLNQSSGDLHPQITQICFFHLCNLWLER